MSVFRNRRHPARIGLFLLVVGGSFLIGMVWHRYKLPPVGMGLLDGPLPPVEVIHDPEEDPSHVRSLAVWGSIFKAYETRQYDIVMLGDSLTAGAAWTELLGRSTVANRAIGGDTVRGFRKRLDQIYPLRPRVCFVMGGINDLRYGRTVEDVLEQYAGLIDELLAADIRPIVQSVLPTDNPVLNAKVVAVNQGLRQLSLKKNLTFIDVARDLTQDSRLHPVASADGLHINGHGYGVWAALVRQTLVELGL